MATITNSLTPQQRYKAKPSSKEKAKMARALRTNEIIKANQNCMPEGEKRCRCCGEVKDFNEFHVCMSSVSGRQPVCITCKKINTDPNRRAEYFSSWYKSNRHKTTALGAFYKARKRIAFSAWADQEKIRSIYAECRNKNILDGAGFWHVDHIVPIRSKLVCGLHNEFNLEIIPSMNNRIKSNSVWPGMP